MVSASAAFARRRHAAIEVPTERERPRPGSLPLAGTERSDAVPSAVLLQIVIENVAKLSPDTVIVTGPQTTVIGGLHFGWNDATSTRSKFAFPF